MTKAELDEKLQELIDMWKLDEELLEKGDSPYAVIANALIPMGFSSIYDIGCDYGAYVPFLQKLGFSYLGVDEDEPNLLYQHRKLVKGPDATIRWNTHFPIALNPKEHSAAISVCALGSLYGVQEIPEQMEALKKEFKHFYCATFFDSILTMRQYWPHNELLRLEGDGMMTLAVSHFWQD